MHFGQAAARQHVTQSALSKQIRRLEADLGGELFERNAGSTRLTVLGRALYADACTLVAQSEQLARSARDVLAGHAGTLRIGFGVATKLLVPAAIARFRASRPGSPSSSTISPPITSCWRWRRGAWILASAACPPQGLAGAARGARPFRRRAARRLSGVAGLADLQEKPLAILRRDKAPSFYDQFIHYLAQSGLRFQDIQYVNDFAAGIATAAAGIAWTLVPPPPPLSIPMC